MYTVSKTLRTLLIVSSLLFFNGCFYLVEGGKGGVAERFPISDIKIELHQRLHRCEAAISRHHVNGKEIYSPVHYQKAQHLVIESRRLYKAEFFMQAQLTLEKAETLLMSMEKSTPLVVVDSTCGHNSEREICL